MRVRSLLGLGTGVVVAGLAMLAGCATKSEAKPPENPPAAAVAAPGAPAAAVAAPGAPAAAAPVDTSASVENLPGVDLAGLDEGQKRWLRELMEKYPSPCARPHSLLTSLRTDPKCKRSIYAGRYLVRLLKAGLIKSEAEEHYENRFVSPEMGQCNVAGAPVKGNPNAPVSLCEFSDFQCPHCKLIGPLLGQLLEEKRDQVKLYFKNYPITKLHPDARDAAAAAVAAGKQGKFWQMHDKLFAHQEQLAPSDLEKYASEIKLDVKKWKVDLTAAREAVDKDHAEGEKLEITGTPTLYINGRKYKGPLRYEELKDWVDEELAK